MFFLNFRRLPNTDYNNLSSNNVIPIGRAFYLNGSGGKIGVWHILPSELSKEYRSNGVHPTNDELEKTLSQRNYKIIFYAHGNSFDRTFYHRVELYNLLSNMNFHVICFDYRGYGDSDGSPTEPGIVSDARVVYDYIQSKVGNNPIIAWGHSMGTGVCCKVVRDLSVEEKAPLGLILESPFNNLQDAVVNHPIFTAFSWMNKTMVRYIFIKPLNSVGLTMLSDERIKLITCPILILHAEDDKILPAKLGKKLYEAARSAKRQVEYQEFSASHQYGHKFICRAPDLSNIIQAFVEKLSKSQ
ncbi:unnamed protein product [Caenorhabditis bovis]|uniref:Serine aminopeptidase S33 domain-containing protein n=1 Tax=Caenorhabditis bovis TaxID=2654633 RepID=A0A8S1EJQ6_9PELO|nr:unnamed protein product [Caenorhabditis bovis]